MKDYAAPRLMGIQYHLCCFLLDYVVRCRYCTASFELRPVSKRQYLREAIASRRSFTMGSRFSDKGVPLRKTMFFSHE